MEILLTRKEKHVKTNIKHAIENSQQQTIAPHNQRFKNPIQIFFKIINDLCTKMRIFATQTELIG
ncbi:MAG: hypothetical protein KBT28_10370 [Bacteroidales bacterium]|nr:hypothetical protein [Candidatus Colimorpha merdihippi]